MASNKPPREFDDMSEEEMKTWSHKQYAKLSEVGEDGLTFANKTANWVAYERKLESERPDALFNDFLAKDFCEPYGKKLSDCFGYGGKMLFDATGDIGFGYEGFACYHAARTKLISDKFRQWFDELEGPKQVVNLGAGVDTRPFWDESMRGIQKYWEVDTKEVLDAKEATLAKKELETHCARGCVHMDFSKESIKDLPSKGIDFSIFTCWILEGLVMYLDKESNEKLVKEISELSCRGSHLILNFMNGQPHHGAAFFDPLFEAGGWKKDKTLYFGDAEFNYGRYPEGKPANQIMGFSFYTKE